MSDFASLGLSKWLCKTCTIMGLAQPTPIQTKSIPAIRKGLNLIGEAQTGSGKTAAFALPILDALGKDPYGIFALVLTPTRELAFQIRDQFNALGATINVRVSVCVGGLDMLSQSAELESRPHIVIATPGRLAGVLNAGTHPLFKHLKYLVLDECDRLIEECFAPDLTVIVKALPPVTRRQTLLMSATMMKFGDGKVDENVERAESILSLKFAECTHVSVIDATASQFVTTLEQRYLFVPQHVKETYLVWLLTKSVFSSQSTIVFVSTCNGAVMLYELLLSLDPPLAVTPLHSLLSQNARLASLAAFRSGHRRVMVCTDIGSRGLDLPAVELVVNYDIARVSEDYVHRAGRTARAGRAGHCVSIVSQFDIESFQNIENKLSIKMDKLDCNEEKVLELLADVNRAKRMARVRMEDVAARDTKGRIQNKRKQREQNKEEKFQRKQQKLSQKPKESST